MELKIKKEDLPKGKIIEVSKSPKIIVFNSGEKYFATSGICPHARWPLELGSVKNNILTCGGHGWEFNISSGECISNPGRDLQQYKIIEEEKELIITEND